MRATNEHNNKNSTGTSVTLALAGEQFFAREVNYLIELGVKDFVQINDIWKAVW